MISESERNLIITAKRELKILKAQVSALETLIRSYEYLETGSFVDPYVFNNKKANLEQRMIEFIVQQPDRSASINQLEQYTGKSKTTLSPILSRSQYVKYEKKTWKVLI